MSATAHGPDVGQLAFDDGAPHHDNQRQVICRAIHDTAWLDGIADPNAVRVTLTDAEGVFTVDPRAYAGAWSWLTKRGVLEPHGWTTSTDRRGGNYGKPLRTRRVADWPALALLAGVES